LFEVFAAGAEAEHEPAFVLAGLGEGGELIDHRFIELDGSAGVGVDLGRRLAVELADVGGHLEGSRLALVVDGSLLNIFFIDGIGFNGIELEVGGGGAEVFGRFVETAQDFVLLIGGGGSGNGGARGEQKHRNQREKNKLTCLMHGFPYLSCQLLASSC